LLESFIIDSDERLKDVQAKGIKEAVLGSWFIAYKIEDAQTFQRVLKGELKGFSVEIFLQQFGKSINDNTDKLNKNELFKMFKNIAEKLKAMLALEETKKAEEVKEEVKKMATAKTEDGKTIEYSEVGEAVSIIGVDGVPTPAEDGEYKLDNGKTIVVASGVATDIKDAEPVEQAEVKEDETKLSTVEEKKEPTELEKLSTQMETLSKQFETLKKENEALKVKLAKQPLTNPIIKEDLKKMEDWKSKKFKNASDLLRAKYDLEETNN
jgi:hypothetical protein